LDEETGHSGSGMGANVTGTIEAVTNLYIHKIKSTYNPFLVYTLLSLSESEERESEGYPRSSICFNFCDACPVSSSLEKGDKSVWPVHLWALV
jgi:hypothetical protein